MTPDFEVGRRRGRRSFVVAAIACIAQQQRNAPVAARAADEEWLRVLKSAGTRSATVCSMCAADRCVRVRLGLGARRAALMRAKTNRGLWSDAPIAPKLHKRPSHAPCVASSKPYGDGMCERVMEACNVIRARGVCVPYCDRRYKRHPHFYVLLVERWSRLDCLL